MIIIIFNCITIDYANEIMLMTGEDADRYLDQDKDNNQRSAIKQGARASMDFMKT